MKIQIYQVDAFADKLFTGNPASVCPLDNWLPDDVLQNIALENNLSETAFFVRTENGFDIRWMTPKAEVDLCGHATLASAYVLFEQLNFKEKTISFHSKSGLLTVEKNKEWLTLNFPVDKIKEIEITEDLIACFHKKPLEAFEGAFDIMLVFSKQEDIEKLEPDLSKISGLLNRGIIATAPGKKTDFVSRYFAPALGVNEDPATGSAHTSLTAYWSNKLNKKDLIAEQLSKRGGYFKCSLKSERVEISGKAVLYLVGEIIIPG